MSQKKNRMHDAYSPGFDLTAGQMLGSLRGHTSKRKNGIHDAYS